MITQDSGSNRDVLRVPSHPSRPLLTKTAVAVAGCCAFSALFERQCNAFFSDLSPTAPLPFLGAVKRVNNICIRSTAADGK